MSRKHFIAFAEIIKAQIDDNDAHSASLVTATRIARDFARIAANDNPKFDAQRFLRACGINS